MIATATLCFLCLSTSADADARAALAMATTAAPARQPAAAREYDDSAPADQDGWRWCQVHRCWWRYKSPAVAGTVVGPALVAPGFLAPGGSASYTVPRPAFYPQPVRYAPAACAGGG